MKKQFDQLERIFAHIQGSDNVVIIIASYNKLDRRKKLTKTVLSNFNVVETKIKTYEVTAIAKSIIGAEGYTISQPALQLLVQRSDQVMDTILSNYNKLKMAATDNKITEKLVEQNIDLSLAQNVFAILESALKHSYREAAER